MGNIYIIYNCFNGGYLQKRKQNTRFVYKKEKTKEKLTILHDIMSGIMDKNEHIG